MAAISHKALFEKLRDTQVIDKCTKYAHWTLPQLMADYTQIKDTGKAEVERDYQEMGALLVNHLASKLAGLLFPVSSSFFKVEPSAALKTMAAQNGLQPDALQSAIAKAETDACKRVFLNASYAQLVLMLKHLIVTGNVLVYRDSAKARTTAYGLQSFAIRRDGQGNLLDAVLRESTYVEALSTEIKEALLNSNRAKYSRPEQTVEVFTRIHRKEQDGRPIYEVTQEVDVIPVGKPSVYPAHLCPWQAPTWNLLPGEHYARGMVEDYAGGMAKLSDLSEAAVLYGIETMRIVHLVGAGSGTDIDDLARAETGEYIMGDPESVKVHEAGDIQKLRAIEEQIASTFGRLAKAFMYEVNTRDAERVTKYELERDAKEAENALGGVYSILSETIQTPLAHILLLEVRPEVLEGLISQNIKLDISAGIPALGRSSDIQNLIAAAQEAAAIIPVLAQLDKRVSPTKLLDAIFASRSVNTELLFKSKEELASEAAAEAQMQQGQAQIAQAAAGADQLAQVDALQQI